MSPALRAKVLAAEALRLFRAVCPPCDHRACLRDRLCRACQPRHEALAARLLDDEALADHRAGAPAGAARGRPCDLVRAALRHENWRSDSPAEVFAPTPGENAA